MGTEQKIIVEKKRLAPAGQHLSASELTLSEKAIAAVIDREITRLEAKIATFGLRDRDLDRISKHNSQDPE